MSTPTQRTFDSDLKLVAAIASAVSLLSFLYYFQRGEILLYGDAVAHINIARRVFDSQTPGLLQLGTVWLPLPHLLMIPFLVSDWMWRTGVGGSIPSMIAYVLGVMGIFRLTLGLLEADERTQSKARVGAWLAALVYAGNPNLIYLQTTAMTEAVYLAFFIWAVVFFAEFLVQQASGPVGLTGAETLSYTKALRRCALCLAGAEVTRYDGWFLAAVVGTAMLFLLRRRWNERAFRGGALKFIVGIAVVPLLWLGYNAAVYGNPLEFANGPHSAKAIERRTAQPVYPAHPGAGNALTAASYILKSAELNMAEGNWGRIWVGIALAGLVLTGARVRAYGATLLLWVPMLFYALSIAYGGVPLFLPAWWPFTWYNLRYGLQLLPLFAVSAALVVCMVSASAAPEGTVHRWLEPSLKRWPERNLLLRVGCAGALVLVALCYAFVWRAQPLCFKEAWVNSRTKLALESSVAHVVASLPSNSQYLMYVGDHVGVFQQAGVPLRQVINEGNHRPWKRPTDAEGLWERALAEPAKYADFVITYDGDQVDQALEKKGLTLVSEIHTSGQPHARIYAARAALNQSR